MYALRGRDLDSALTYVDRALDMQPTAQNYRLKARILKAKGDAAAAKLLADRAAQLMPPTGRRGPAPSCLWRKRSTTKHLP